MEHVVYLFFMLNIVGCGNGVKRSAHLNNPISVRTLEKEVISKEPPAMPQITVFVIWRLSQRL